MKLPRIPLRRQKLPKVMGKVLRFGEGAESQVLLLSGQRVWLTASFAGSSAPKQSGEHGRAVTGTHGSLGAFQWLV